MLVVFISPVILFFQSCGKDDPAPIVMVVAERNSGKLFILNSTTASKTEVAEIKLVTGAPITNIRAMVYHKSSKKIFASSTDDGDGVIYSINPGSMQASVINSNPNDHWYGVADMIITSDNNILASLWFESESEVGYGPGFIKMNTDGTVTDMDIFTNENICCGMGIIANGTNKVLIASSDLEIYESDLNGTVELMTTLTLEGFDLNDPGEYAIQNMVKDAKGNIFATVYCWDNGNTYLAKINLTTSKLIKVGQLNVGNTNRYHGLMLISKDLL